MLANRRRSIFSVPTADAATVKSRLTVPAGYGIRLFARDMPDARMLRMTARRRRAGGVAGQRPRVLALQRADGDGAGGRAARAARRSRRSERSRPSGTVISTSPSKARWGASSSTMRPAGRGQYEIVIDGLPKGGNHWKKTIRFGPGRTAVSEHRFVVQRLPGRGRSPRCDAALHADGKFVDVYATGLRNSAGFDWRADGTLYATDNGRDLLGDDFPPCELDQIRQGGFYGWPFANGDRVPDPDLGAGREAVIDGVDSAGVLVPRPQRPVGNGVPEERPQRRGVSRRCTGCAARIVESQQEGRLQGRGAALGRRRLDSCDDFLTGFLVDENVIGRPAELAEASDGTIYVSDDYANAVYRIVPGGPDAR